LLYGQKLQEVGVIKIALNPEQFEREEKCFEDDFIALEMKK
jgi:hypothetical protein